MKQKKPHGFSLIEAAIVLAMIGLIIGGIWAAATTVQTARLQQQYYTGWSRLISRAQENLSQTEACNSSVFTITDQSSGMGPYIWPPEWNGWRGSQFRRASGQSLMDMGGTIYCSSTNSRYLAVNFYDYTYAACRQLVTRFRLPEVEGANVCTGAAMAHTIYIPLPRRD